MPEIPKKGVEQKRGKEKQRFLKGTVSRVKRQEVGALKRGTGTPLETMTP